MDVRERLRTSNTPTGFTCCTGKTGLKKLRIYIKATELGAIDAMAKLDMEAALVELE